MSVLHAKSEISQTSFNQYLKGRFAESAGDSIRAAEIYARALKQQPQSAEIAKRAYVQAVLSGDYALTVKSVEALQTLSEMDPDMPLVLFADRFASRDFDGAKNALNELEALGNFAFLRPYLENWLLLARDRNAPSKLRRNDISQNGSYYFDEQVMLLDLAAMNDAQAPKYVASNLESRDARSAPLRIAVARHLLSINEHQAALSVVSEPRTGPESRLQKTIESGDYKSQRSKISASSGLSFLFRRLSSDLVLQQAVFPALAMAQLADNIEPDNDQSKLALGKAYSDLKKPESARRYFEQISMESPYYLVAVNSEVAALTSAKKFDDAKTLSTEAILSSPESPELRIIMGQTLQANDEYEAAALMYQKAIELANKYAYGKPALANYWLLLGSAQDEGNLWPDARASLEKANEILPDNANILNYLGYSQLERRENITEAMAAIQRAYELQPQSGAITDSLGWSHYLLGNHERAVGLLEQALEKQPQDPTINEHLGDAYWTVGRKYEARYAWKNARLLADTSENSRLDEKIATGLTANLVSP